MTGKPRAKFITIIAQSIYRFKNYPTEDEYIQVVQELVKKWPFLDNGMGVVSDLCAVFTICVMGGAHLIHVCQSGMR